MLAEIFETFVQVEQNLDKAQGGLGLGLSLAKHLVAMHGGTKPAATGPARDQNSWCACLSSRRRRTRLCRIMAST
jgi:signal transduction histidine kinase